jgi:hypothetical protein
MLSYEMDMWHFDYDFHLSEFWAHFSVTLSGDVTIWVGNINGLWELCDTLRPSRNSLEYFRPSLELIPVLYNGWCIAR